MTSLLTACLFALLAVLNPAKWWYAPDQPIAVTATTDASLVLTDFAGKTAGAQGSPDVAAGQSVDVRKVFPALNTPGTYVLFSTAKGVTDVTKFQDTPLVIEVRQDLRRGAPDGPLVYRLAPLKYAVIHTEAGDMTVAFYYDGAPNTVQNFLDLAAGGFYNGLGFHRIVPSFVIQTGDPRGDGTGGPGYNIDAEFNNREHNPGVLSMARSGDPNEAVGGAPRPEFANSAGSQFFICLDYTHTKPLDRKYTAFGIVTTGMDAVNKIAAAPIADQRTGRPEKPPVISSIEVLPVTREQNPYADIIRLTTNETLQPDATPAANPTDSTGNTVLPNATPATTRPGEPAR